MTRALFLAVLALLAACAPPPDLTEADRARLADPPPPVRTEVARLTPKARAYVDAVEAAALARGRPLTPVETDTARALGVARPERVRIFEARRLPSPDDPDLALFELPGIALGLTSGYGITLKRGFVRSWLVSHELVHVAQFERLGRDAMVRRYLTELLVLPDNLIPIEREAIAASEALTGPGGTYAY